MTFGNGGVRNESRTKGNTMQTTMNELDKATKRKIRREYKKHGEFAWQFSHGTFNVNKHWRFKSFENAHSYAISSLRCVIRDTYNPCRAIEFRQYLYWKNEARERLENIREYTKELPLP